jgi:hypothetical protein
MPWHKHSSTLLRLEHEGYFVLEEVVPQPEGPPMDNNLYFDTCGEEPSTPATQGNPRCIYPFPCFFKFYHL